MLPDSMLLHIGQIGVTWGAFENRLAELLTALIIANGTKQKGQQFYPYPQKQEIAIAETNKYFSMYPLVTIRLIEIIHYSLALQENRNFLLHGNLILKVETKQLGDEIAADSFILATKRQKKQVITKEFSADELENLAYAIGHLNGIMNDFLNQNGRWALRLALRDRCFLQAFLASIPPPRSILATNPPTPPPRLHYLRGRAGNTALTIARRASHEKNEW
jgi:hypothetical protein